MERLVGENGGEVAAYLVGVVVACLHQLPEQVPPETERRVADCRSMACLLEVVPGGRPGCRVSRPGGQLVEELLIGSPAGVQQRCRVLGITRRGDVSVELPDRRNRGGEFRAERVSKIWPQMACTVLEVSYDRTPA